MQVGLIHFCRERIHCGTCVFLCQDHEQQGIYQSSTTKYSHVCIQSECSRCCKGQQQQWKILDSIKLFTYKEAAEEVSNPEIKEIRVAEKHE